MTPYVWTSTPPDRPGWWWLRWGQFDTPVQIIQNPGEPPTIGHSYPSVENAQPTRDGLPGALWSDRPIPEPAAPPAEVTP